MQEKVCDVFHVQRQKNVEKSSQNFNILSKLNNIPFHLFFQAKKPYS